jgi:hypothetical protein
VLIRGSENVHRTFEIVGLDRQLTFVDDHHSPIRRRAEPSNR